MRAPASSSSISSSGRSGESRSEATTGIVSSGWCSDISWSPFRAGPPLPALRAGSGGTRSTQDHAYTENRTDPAAAGEQQHAQRLLTLACPRQRQDLARKRRARRSERVERVVLAAEPPLRADAASNLDRRLALVRQIAREAGAVVTGAFDCPHTRAARTPVRNGHRLAI